MGLSRVEIGSRECFFGLLDFSEKQMFIVRPIGEEGSVLWQEDLFL